ncbi:MAG: LCP family protein [Candidatus Magasanikbacteria bacterium]
MPLPKSTFSPILCPMDEEYSAGSNNFLEQEPEYRQGPPRKKRRLFLFLLTCFLLFGSFLVTKAMQTEIPDDPMAYDPVTLEPKKPEGLLKRLKHFIFQKEVDLEGQEEDRINILILGMGGPGHDGPYLTDTIIIASVKPSNGQIAMISIPRDLGVNIPKYGWRKINSANALGEVNKPNWGAAYTTELIENTFDIDIHYYARVDFKAFEEIIDEVGGITVNVDRSFVDREYPAAADKYQVVSFTKGEQKMEGNDALKYARSRHGNNGEGSDFARARRQQKVLLAPKGKSIFYWHTCEPCQNSQYHEKSRHSRNNEYGIL